MADDMPIFTHEFYKSRRSEWEAHARSMQTAYFLMGVGVGAIMMVLAFVLDQGF